MDSNPFQPELQRPGTAAGEQRVSPVMSGSSHHLCGSAHLDHIAVGVLGVGADVDREEG